MKIKKVDELNENINFNHDDSMNKLVREIMDALKIDVDEVDQENIDYIAEMIEEYKVGNSSRQILPDMVRLSNNSRITQSTAEIIADKLPKDKFRDFMTWLKLVEQNCSNKTKNKFF